MVTRKTRVPVEYRKPLRLSRGERGGVKARQDPTGRKRPIWVLSGPLGGKSTLESALKQKGFDVIEIDTVRKSLPGWASLPAGASNPRHESHERWVNHDRAAQIKLEEYVDDGFVVVSDHEPPRRIRGKVLLLILRPSDLELAIRIVKAVQQVGITDSPEISARIARAISFWRKEIVNPPYADVDGVFPSVETIMPFFANHYSSFVQATT